MAESFSLHPRLAADTFELGQRDDIAILLMNDARWPWLILVPQQPRAVEIDDLDGERRRCLFDLAALLAARLRAITGATKTNVASLGNMVPQLHLHLIARHPQDPAWPGPVWGVGTPQPYPDDRRAELLRQWRSLLDPADPD